MNRKVFTLAELAEYTHSKLVGDPNYTIMNVADLESAEAQDASFLANPRYEKAMGQSRAGVVFVTPSTSPLPGRNFLVNENPSRAFQMTIEALRGTANELTGFEGIHPTAVIHETSKIGKNVKIGPHVVIDKNVTIGDGTCIGAGCYIGPHVTIGQQCLLHPHVTIREECFIGNRVILQPGVVIGSCGFGYITDKQGHHIKLNQVGTVTIEDDVEIGANTTIDRSRFKTTLIKRGSKIDNLVQIGHGAIIGEHNIIVAQTGIAGSSETGKHVVIGGQAAVAGHIKICNGAMIAARAGVSKSITQPGKYGGLPAIPLTEHNRNSVYLRNIENYVKQLKELQEKIQKHLDNSVLE